MYKQEKENELKLQGTSRDFSWYSILQDESKLTMSGLLLGEKNFEIFRSLVRCVEEMYPGKWDIDFRVNVGPNDVVLSVDITGIVIKFDSVTIRNRDRREHVLQDLFIKIVLFQDTFIKISTIEGGRMTITEAEKRAEYFHSHLSYSYSITESTSKGIYFSSFCLGSGEIGSYIGNFNRNTNESKFEDFFIPILTQLMILVSYESIEGNPYRYMSSITSNGIELLRSNYNPIGQNEMEHLVSTGNIDNLLTKLKERGKFQLSLTDGKYVFSLDNLEVDIKELIELNLVSNFNMDSLGKIFCYKDFAGNTYRFDPYNVPQNISEGNTYIANKKPYIFQGEEIFLKVVPNLGTNLTFEDGYHFLPYFKTLLTKTITNYVNNKKIRKSTVQKYYTPKDTSGSVGSSEVLVLEN